MSVSVCQCANVSVKVRLSVDQRLCVIVNVLACQRVSAQYVRVSVLACQCANFSVYIRLTANQCRCMY